MTVKLFSDKALEKEFRNFALAAQEGGGPAEHEQEWVIDEETGEPKIDKRTGEKIPAPRSARAAVGISFKGPFRMLMGFVVHVAVSMAKAAAKRAWKEFDDVGAREMAEKAMDEIGEGGFIDWLKNGGLEQIIAFIMQLLAIFAK